MSTKKPVRKIFSVSLLVVLLLTLLIGSAAFPSGVLAAAGWTATGSLNTARWAHTATLLLNGKVLVVGGFDGSSNLASAELYDPATGLWTATGSLNTARSGHSATRLLNGKVLVVGGSGSTAELYDPATGLWTATGSLNTARSGHSATLLLNGEVLVAGGYSGGALASAELYDPATGLWTATDPLVEARYSHPATLLPDGGVLVAGGSTSGFTYTDSAELYDPATGLWEAADPLHTPLYGHTATLLPNGQVLVAEGYDSGDVFTGAELYDPATGIWTMTGSMNEVHGYGTATLLPDGTVLLAGGFGCFSCGTVFNYTAELYDPASGLWTATGSMAQGRWIHTATLLLNGQVLVAGGYVNGGIASAGAELYGDAAPMIDQTIGVTTPAPASAAYGSSFTVAATATSGLTVSYSATGACINVGPLFTMTSGMGNCTVRYDQAGDGTHNPAPQVTEVLAAQTLPIMVTADAQSKVYGDADPALTYQVTSGALVSGDSFTGSLTRAPGENSGVYAILQGSLTAGSNYDLAYVGGDLMITKADQTISVTIDAPATAATGQVFTVSADASSGLPVSYSASGACTNLGTSFTMTDGSGICIVHYDQAGNTNYNPAPPITQAVGGGDAPSLLEPAEGEHLLNNRPTFDWTDVTDAASYTIQISANIGFTSPTSNTVTLSTYTPTANLPANVTRYWRVQATTAAGPGPWSAVRSFFTARPPSAPSLASPANNSLSTDYTPLLNWNDSTVPAGTTFLKYELQIAADAAFTFPTSVDVSGPVTNSEYTPGTDLNPNTTYYWRVRAYNTLGQYSAWSAVRHFRTALLPPTLTSPADAAQLLNNRPTFDWADVPDVTGYRLQISDDAGFATTLVNVTVTPSTYTRTSDLPAGEPLYWRVQSRGTNGPSAWSDVLLLTTANPPSVPALVSPGNNAKASGPSPLFDWNDSTIPAGVVFDYYQIQIATDSAFTTMVHDQQVAGITNSQDNTAVLAPETTYSWRVRSVNADGQYSAWSTVRAVRIKFAGPTLTLPASDSTASNLMPTFTWDAVGGAASYRIQVSRSSVFNTLVINRTGIVAPTYTHTTNLQAGTTYYWRVRVDTPTNTYGPGNWSAVFTFTTP